jgi:hypothetical protein
MLLKENNILRLAATVIFSMSLAFGLSSCEKSLSISDKELVERAGECRGDKNMTPGAAVSCDNYFKECARRGKKTGNYLC